MNKCEHLRGNGGKFNIERKFALIFSVVLLIGALVFPVCALADDNVFYINAGGKQMKVLMENNAAATELMKILENGDLTVNTTRHGGFEQVGSLGQSLPASNTQITTEPGDVILYNSNQLVVFYGSNTWSYTRLGKIQGMDKDELESILSADSLTMTLSLNSFGNVPSTGLADYVLRRNILIFLIPAGAFFWAAPKCKESMRSSFIPGGNFRR